MYIVDYNVCTCIKTHDSESWGQEEAGRMQQTSELFTGNTTLKLVILSAAIASFMALVYAPKLKKSPWHPFTRLLE